MEYLRPIDCSPSDFGDFYDELPLWSARFGTLLLDQVTLRPNSTILDVGSGTGFLSVELAQRCGTNSRVIAVDPWEAAVARLNRKIDYLKLPNIETRVEDVSETDLLDASVDLIVSNLGLNNFSQPAAALQSCFRVAKPGAGLFFTTNLMGHMSEFYDVFRSVLIDLGHVDRLAFLDAHIKHRATEDSVRKMLEQAGFEFVRAVHSSFFERFIDGSSLLRHHFIRLGFVPGWKGVMRQELLEESFRRLEEGLNERARELGELCLTVPVACIEARKPLR